MNEEGNVEVLLTIDYMKGIETVDAMVNLYFLALEIEVAE